MLSSPTSLIQPSKAPSFGPRLKDESLVDASGATAANAAPTSFQFFFYWGFECVEKTRSVLRGQLESKKHCTALARRLGALHGRNRRHVETSSTKTFVKRGYIVLPNFIAPIGRRRTKIRGEPKRRLRAEDRTDCQHQQQQLAQRETPPQLSRRTSF
jgi:hypothetical protein